MKTRYIFIIAIVAVLAIVIVAVSFFHERLRRNRESQLAARYLSAFRSLDPIDAHTHVFRASPDFSAMLARLNVRVLDILYVDDTDSYLRTLDTERNDALSFINSASGPCSRMATMSRFRRPLRER